MNPWWLIALGGLLGSSHCVGMCGGFAALVGLNTRSLRANLRAQIVFSLGRLTSYATLGSVAGFDGRQMTASVPSFINVPAILSIGAGALLIREGVLALGLLPLRITGSSSFGCLMAPLFSRILKSTGLRNTFVAGIATGLLPCGLVYAFVSMAASSADMLQGIGIMLAFGSGTIPLMIATGCGASLMSWSSRQRLWKLAACSVVLTGVLTTYRGISFLRVAPSSKDASCPFCRSAKTSPSVAIPRPMESEVSCYISIKREPLNPCRAENINHAD